MKSKCALFAFFLQASFLYPTQATWVSVTGGSGQNNVWDNNSNWNPTTAPGTAAGDEADLVTPTTVVSTINLTALTTLGTLYIDSAQDYLIQQSGSGTFLFQMPIASQSASINITSANGNGPATITAPMALGSSLIISQGSTGTFTIGPGISGSGSITKGGTGLLVFAAGANTYSGGTIISGGTLSVSSDSALGNPATTAVTIGNGTLQLNTAAAAFTSARPISLTAAASVDVTSTANNATLSGVISGVGSLTKTDSGTLILQGVNTYQGGTTVAAGELSISNDNNLGNATGPLAINGTGILLTTAGISSSRSGTFSGTPTLMTGGNTDTFSGSFSGGGALTIQGGGTVVFTGTNSYSGGTTVATGTQLAGTTNGLQGTILLNTNSSLLTFSQNFNGSFGGVIQSATSGAGALTIQGAGAVTFTNSSPTFTGPTNITQGTLTVNGSIANSSLVTVGASTTLSGSGTVGPTVSSGTIAPGNGSTAGTLSINGTLMTNAGSNVTINIAPLSANNIAVSSTAMIDATSLTVAPASGFYGFSATYTILTSTGLTVTGGGFTPVTSTNPNFIPSVYYSANDAFLNIVITSPFAAFPFSNFNTAAVGNNFDALYAANELSADLFNVISTFIGQSNSAINFALDQMHPAPFSAFTEMQTELDGQLLSLFHRLPYLPCSCNNPNRLWIEPFGNTLTVKKHGLEIGFQANSGGIACGYDGAISENFVVGVGGAWSSSHLAWHDHRGHGDVTGLYGGAYFDSQIDHFYLGGSILAGVDFYDTSRHIQFVTTDRRAAAHFKALDIMAQISMAYLFGAPLAYFYPYANFDYLYLNTGTFKEKGAQGLDLSVQARTDGTLRSEMGLGLQIQDKNYNETICVSPLISLGWVNMAPLQRPLIKSTFVGASIPFSVRGWDETWNLFNINFGLSIAYRCYSFAIQYNAEMAPDADTLLFNQHGNIRFDWKW